MRPKVMLQEQPLDGTAIVDYQDANGVAWQFYPLGGGYRHSACVVCGREHLAGGAFFMNMETGECACNREKCCHVEPAE